MAVRVAINGFGRIGRPTFKRIMDAYPELELVAINDLGNITTLAHLLQHDSVYGAYEKEVSVDGEYLIVGGKKVLVTAEKDPALLPWKKLGVDIVLECTGRFVTYEGASKHVKAGARYVVISAPCKNPDQVPSYILGLNEEKFSPENDHIMDMGSCTTNAFALLTKVVQDAFGIERGFMTTIHSYTNDQRILDLEHRDLRRSRAAALNIIPTTTGAANTIEKVIPEVKGKIEAMAYRVPTPAGSILEAVFQVPTQVSVQEVRAAFKKASESSKMKGYLGVEHKELVSSDYVGTTYSVVVDDPITAVTGNLVRVAGWYDNEWGYATRLGDFTNFIAQRIS